MLGCDAWRRTWKAVSPAALAIIIGLGTFSGQAAAAEFISALCTGHVRPYDSDIYKEPTEFDRKRQRGWYKRAWTGDCDLVPFPDRWTCVHGHGTAWNKIIADIDEEARRSNASQPSRIRRETCEIAETIGLEWAKDNERRCIHTNDLHFLRQKLLGTATPVSQGADILERLAGVRADVLRKLGCRGKL